MYEICKRLILIAGGLASMVLLVLVVLILIAALVNALQKVAEERRKR